MKPKYATLYEDDYFKGRHHDRKRDVMYQQELSRLKPLLPKTGTVLDVGCGMGNFLDLFDDKNWKKYGLEVSAYALKYLKKKGVNTVIPNQKNLFDLVIFRGTIQHLNNPLYEIEKRIAQLKPGGIMAFLITPNAGGIYYRLFQDLPMLDPERNFVIFSDKELTQSLKNFGLHIVKVYYPYKETPYASPIKDYLFFILRLLRIKKFKHAFPGNTMEIYARKPKK